MPKSAQILCRGTRHRSNDMLL